MIGKAFVCVIMRSGVTSGKGVAALLNIKRLDVIDVLASQLPQNIKDNARSNISFRSQDRIMRMESRRIKAGAQSDGMKQLVVNIIKISASSSY